MPKITDLDEKRKKLRPWNVNLLDDITNTLSSTYNKENLEAVDNAQESNNATLKNNVTSKKEVTSDFNVTTSKIAALKENKEIEVSQANKPSKKESKKSNIDVTSKKEVTSDFNVTNTKIKTNSETSNNNVTPIDNVTSKKNLTSDFNVTSKIASTLAEVSPQAAATALTTEEKLSGGFSMMPNALIMAFISGEIDKSEFQILCLIVRLSIGYQKEFAELSLNQIAKLTGFQTTRISTLLKTLAEKEAIVRISGDSKKPNKLSLSNKYKSNIINSPNVKKERYIEKEGETLHQNFTSGVTSKNDVTLNIYNKYNNINTLSQSNINLEDSSFSEIEQESASVVGNFYSKLGERNPPSRRMDTAKQDYRDLIKAGYTKQDIQNAIDWLLDKYPDTKDFSRVSFYINQAVSETRKVEIANQNQENLKLKQLELEEEIKNQEVEAQKLDDKFNSLTDAEKNNVFIKINDMLNAQGILGIATESMKKAKIRELMRELR